MEKFLSIPVIDSTISKSRNQLVSITGIKVISQFSTTQATIYYLNGRITTLTWGVAISDVYDDTYRLSLEGAISKALSSGWTQVVTEYLPYGFIPNAETPDNPTNPLTAIVIT